MNTAVKICRVAKLDFMLVAGYVKYLLFYLLFPFFFFFFGTQSLVGGMVTAMCMFSMAAALIFQSEESENGAALYGFLPVSRTQRVAGRYLSTLALGGAGYLVSLVLQSLALTLMKVHISGVEYGVALMLPVGLFLLINAVQIPVYFRYGSVRGRILSLAVLALWIAACVLGFGFLAEDSGAAGLLSGPVSLAIAGGVLGAGALLFAGSVFVSAKIMQKRK